MPVWLLACALLADPEPVKLPPAVSLSLDVAEAVGARVQKLSLETDATVSEAERELIEAALGKTGLFTLTAAEAATARLSITRVDPGFLLAAVTDTGGNRLWVARVAWEVAVVPATPPDREVARKSVMRYRRDRVRIVPVSRGAAPSPMVMGGWSSRWFGDPVPWGLGFADGMPISNAPNDWLLLRGAAEVLDELEFARILEDRALVARIEEARFWPELFWATGFGAGALAGVGTGAWLSTFDDRDTRALGVSLITVGAVSAVLALMFPAAAPAHVLSVPEAQTQVDAYNEQLRQQLGLTADDIARQLPDG